MKFDVQAALNAGATDDQIAKFVCNKTGYDYKAMKAKGYNPVDIYQTILNQDKPAKPSQPKKEDNRWGITKAASKTIDQLEGAGYTALQNIGDMTGSDSLKAFGEAGAKNHEVVNGELDTTPIDFGKGNSSQTAFDINFAPANTPDTAPIDFGKGNSTLHRNEPRQQGEATPTISQWQPSFLERMAGEAEIGAYKKAIDFNKMIGLGNFKATKDIFVDDPTKTVEMLSKRYGAKTWVGKQVDSFVQSAASLPIDIGSAALTGGAAKVATASTAVADWLSGVSNFVLGSGIQGAVKGYEKNGIMGALTGGTEGSVFARAYEMNPAGIKDSIAKAASKDLGKFVAIGVGQTYYNAAKQGRIPTAQEVNNSVVQSAAMSAAFITLPFIEKATKIPGDKIAIGLLNRRLNKAFSSNNMEEAQEAMNKFFKGTNVSDQAKQEVFDVMAKANGPAKEDSTQKQNLFNDNEDQNAEPANRPVALGGSATSKDIENNVKDSITALGGSEIPPEQPITDNQEPQEQTAPVPPETSPDQGQLGVEGKKENSTETQPAPEQGQSPAEALPAGLTPDIPQGTPAVAPVPQDNLTPGTKITYKTKKGEDTGTIIKTHPTKPTMVYIKKSDGNKTYVFKKSILGVEPGPKVSGTEGAGKASPTPLEIVNTPAEELYKKYPEYGKEVKAEQEKEQAKNKAKSEAARKIDSAVKTLKNEILDWSNRKYKKNDTMVSAGGIKDDLNAGTTSISAANEKRRKRNIQDRKRSILELEKIKKRLENGEDEQKLYGELLDSKYAPLVDFAEKQLSGKKTVAKETTKPQTKSSEKEDKKRQATIKKIRTFATKLKKSNEEKYNQDREENTPRRAQMASNARADASHGIQVAKTMLNIADLLESGYTGPLEKVKTATHVKALESALHLAQYETWKKQGLSYGEQQQRKGEPFSAEDVKHLKFDSSISLPEGGVNTLRKDLRKHSGGKKLASKIHGTELSPDLAKSLVAFEKKIKGKGTRFSLPGTVEDQLKDYNRYKAMGVSNSTELKALAREYIKVREGGIKEDPVKEAERKLIGTKPGVDFFPTPKTIANVLVKRADIQKDDKVLEPSAGKGDIADVIKEKHPDSKLDTVELSPTLNEILKLKKHNVTGSDFLEHTGEYDKIIMNPPFSKGMDVDHVMHAYSLLKPGGKIVAIMSEHPFFASDKKSIAFREWLSDKGTSEKLPEKSFTGKEAFRQTGVNSRVVEIKKPNEGKTETPKQAAQPEEKRTYKPRTWFKLGEEVSWAYKDKTGKSSPLKPNKEVLKETAQKLGITVADAERGLSVYHSGDPSYDENLFKDKKIPIVSVPKPDAHGELKPKQPNKAEQKAKKAPQGEEGTSYLSDGTPIKFKYEVVDLPDLVQSHDVNGTPNPDYTEGKQPRDRSKEAYLLQTDKYAANLAPEAHLGKSPNFATGAPLVSPDSNEIEAGHGRTQAITKAYNNPNNNKGAEYKKWVETNAAKYGIKLDGKISHPVLIRRRITPVDDIKAITEGSNDSITAQMSATEQARVDSGNLTSNDLSLFRPDNDGNINAASNRPFVSRFLKKMTVEEQVHYVGKNGEITKQLVDRIQAAIFQKAYGSDELSGMATEDANPDIKNILNGMTAGAVDFAKARGLNGKVADPIIKDIVDGVLYLRQAQKEYPDLKAGKNATRAQTQLAQALAQQDMFNAKVPKEVEQVASFLADNIRSGKRIGEFLSSVGHYLKKGIADLKQMDAFGTKDTLNSRSLIDTALQQLEDKYDDKQQDLFSRQAIEEPKAAFYGLDNETSDKKGEPEEDSKRSAVETPDKVKEPQNGKARQLDLFEFQAEELQKVKIPGKLQAKQKVSTTRVGRTNLAKDGYIIQSPQDAASFLAHLVLEPQENAYFVALDKNGKVLEVVRHTVGTRGQSLIDPIAAVTPSFRFKNIDKIVFAHNHPSGDMEASSSDKNILSKIKQIASLKNIDILPLIVGDSEFIVFNEQGDTSKVTPIKNTIKKEDIPLSERIFRKRVKKTDKQIMNHKDAQNRLEKEEDGFLLLNSRNQETGFLPFPSGMSQKEITARVLEAVEKTNATSILINNKPPKNASGRLLFLKKLSDALLKNDVKVFDIFSYTKTGTVVNDPQDLTRDAQYNIEDLNKDDVQYQVAYHASPFTWEAEPGFPYGRPRLDKIFSKETVGEGAWVFGAGWYSGESKDAIRSYLKRWQGDSFSVNGVDYKVTTEGIIDVETNEKLKGLEDDTIHSLVANDFDREAAIEDLKYRYRNDKNTDITSAVNLIKNAYIKNAASLYKLDIPDEIIPHLLDWDEPFSEQTEYVKKALQPLMEYLKSTGRYSDDVLDSLWGEQLYGAASEFVINKGTPDSNDEDIVSSRYLASVGIPGDKYLDGESRNLQRIALRDDPLLKAQMEKDKKEILEIKKELEDNKNNSNLLPHFFESRKERIALLNRQILSTKRTLEASKRGDGLTYNYVLWNQKVIDQTVLLKRNEKILERVSSQKKQAGITAPVTLQKVKSYFKSLNLKTGVTPEGHVWVRSKSGLGFTVETVKRFSDKEYEVAINSGAMKSDGHIAGQLIGHKIKISSDFGDEQTLIHEVIHLMEKAGIFSKLDLSVLDTGLKNRTGLAKDDKITLSKDSRENRANYLSKVLANRKMDRSTPLGRVVQKVADFMDALRNTVKAIVTGEKQSSVRKLAKGIETGDIYNREGKPNTSANSQYETTADMWYSQMENFLSQKLNNGNAETIKSQLQSWAKKGKFKQEELEWSGVMDWLNDQKGKVKKQDVLDFLNKNRVQIKEVMRGADKYSKELKALSDRQYNGETLSEEELNRYRELSRKETKKDTKFSEYTEPGGKNYRELLLTLPTPINKGQEQFKAFQAKMEEKYGVSGVAIWDKMNDKETAELDRLDKAASETAANNYKSPHWDEPNTFVTARMSDYTDRDGNKVLVLHEMQDDWASDIRKKGVKKDLTYSHKKDPEMGGWSVYDSEGNKVSVNSYPTESGAIEAAKTWRNVHGAPGIPDYPFKNTSYDLMLRRLVRYAAENGYDKIAWFPGSTHTKRWGSEKIAWEKTKDGWEVEVKEQVSGHAGNIADIEAAAREKGILLEETVTVRNKAELKEAIRTIARREENSFSKENFEKMLEARTNKIWARMQKENSGVSFPRKESFENIYDEQLVNKANKFFNKKKWGKAKVGETEIKKGPEFKIEKNGNFYSVTDPDGNIVVKNTTKEKAEQFLRKPIKIHTLSITPQMKKKALREGMPLYQTKHSNETNDKYKDSVSTISHVIDLPEIVELAKDLQNGKNLKLVNVLRAAGGKANGSFSPNGDGSIKVVRSLFEDTDQTKKEIAYNIGKIVDYLPDKTLARGNILGSIASLKKYMKHTISASPDIPSELTPKDRIRLKREANKLVSKEKDTWIDEVVTKRIPVKPKDILGIWNSLEDSKLLNKNLYDYIASLNTAQKKAVISAALRGVVKDDLQRFSEIVNEPTGKKIKQTLSDEEFKKRVSKKYADLINKELSKRKMFSLEQTMNELKAFSETWKPFDPAANFKVTNYRFSPRELYADAFSGLVNAPGLLKEKAPNFYEGFFNYLKRKPEVEAKWKEIQDRIGKGSDEVSNHRIDGVYEMFRRSANIHKGKNLERKGNLKGFIDVLGRGMWDEDFPIQKELAKLTKKGGEAAEHARATKWMMETTEYLASEVNDMMHEINKKVLVHAERNDISNDDIGAYLMMKHIEKNREGIASTRGFYKESVQKDLKTLEKRLGKEKFDTIVELAKEYRKIREKRIIPLIEKSGLATPNFLKIIKDRTFYAKMSVIHWLEEKYGGTATATFKAQVGSLEDIDNPFVATMLQDIAVIKAARLNMTKTELVKDLEKLDLIKKAPEEFTKGLGKTVAQDPKDPRFSMFMILRDGKPVYYHVSKEIAEAFDKRPFEATQMAQFWHYASQPIREILVNKNPIWMARNPGRDFLSTVKNNPEIKLRHTIPLLKEYKKAWKEVWAEAMKGERSKFISQMYQNKELLSNRVWGGKEENYEDEIQRISDSFGLSEREAHDEHKYKKQLKTAWEFLDNLGRATEIWGKVSGKRFLIENTNLSEAEIGHRVRGRIGTPNVKARPAWQQTLNNVFMFSTVGKEGIRAALESYREDKATYLWKTAMINILPKVLLATAAKGLLGGYNKAMVDRVSEYNKSHYTVIPLFIDKRGKVHYLRIPQDYEGQYFGSIFWKLLNLKVSGPQGALNELVQAQPYQLHPLISVGMKLADYYLKGQDPVDSYRGEYILPRRVFRVGGGKAAWDLGKYAWKNLGFSVFYNPSYSDIEKQRTDTEKFLRSFPGNILGTFYQISDYGLQEQLQAEFDASRKQQARQSLAADKNIANMSPQQKVALYSMGDANVKKKLIKIWLRQKNTAYSNAMANARSKKEIWMVLQRMAQDHRLLRGK